jgi:hypothetical protein
MQHSSTILTVGTALRRAQDGGVQVHVLVGGFWMTGDVLGLDGEGAVLQTSDGDTIVLRIQAVTAVRVEQAIAADDLREEPAAPKSATPSWHPESASYDDDSNVVGDRIRAATEIFTRDLVELHREPQPA